MTQARKPRSTRDRPAKAPLSVEAIVEAALGIVRADGLESVSMRRIATAMDTGPGSLYVYVAGREDLVRLVFDRVIATVTLEEPDAARWRAQLHALLVRLRDALLAHPGIAAAAMIDPPRTSATLDLLENLLGILLAGGLGVQNAVWTADVLSAQTTYSAIEAEIRHTDADTIAAEVSANIAGLAADRYPLITAHRKALVAGSVDDRFRFAIDALVDGALAREA